MKTSSPLSVPVSALLLPALLLGSTPSSAVSPATPSAPVQNSGSASEAVQTPMDDLNLRKREIPAVLQDAVQNPYATGGLGQCSQITTAVESLNAALGDDIDLPREGGMHLSASELADFAASTFIPFRDIIRAVSGADSRRRQLQEAVLAGFARRSFLKGLGASRRCAYPASPATPQIIAAKTAALTASLETQCANFDQQSKREQYLNRRKCTDYRSNPPPPAPAKPAPTAGTK